jgi:type III secretion system (T3SS) negative regulator GrlR
MVEGFWIVQYEGMQGSGGGVAMFIKGKVFGGDTGYTYLGTYTTQGNSVQARVMVRNFIAGIPSVVGITGDFELSIDGMVEGNVIKGTGSLVGVQRPGIAVKLSKRADIPTE